MPPTWFASSHPRPMNGSVPRPHQHGRFHHGPPIHHPPHPHPPQPSRARMMPGPNMAPHAPNGPPFPRNAPPMPSRYPPSIMNGAPAPGPAGHGHGPVPPQNGHGRPHHHARPPPPHAPFPMGAPRPNAGPMPPTRPPHARPPVPSAGPGPGPGPMQRFSLPGHGPTRATPTPMGQNKTIMGGPPPPVHRIPPMPVRPSLPMQGPPAHHMQQRPMIQHPMPRRMPPLPIQNSPPMRASHNLVSGETHPPSDRQTHSSPVPLARPDPRETPPSPLRIDAHPSPSPPTIPPPPSEATAEVERAEPKRVSPTSPVLAAVEENTKPEEGPLRESKRQNIQEETKEQPGKEEPKPTPDMAVDAASILLELRSSSPLVPPPPPVAAAPPVQKEEFPAYVPKNFPKRLALPQDSAKLNSLHCYLRSELLEIFVVEKSANKSPTHSPGSSVGRVGLRCVHCAMSRRAKDDRDEAPMAVFYPKSIGEIYRLVTSWQRCHLRKCRNLPPEVRKEWTSLREFDKSRGKTHYWITSAEEIGLVDCTSRAGGIRFAAKNEQNNREENSQVDDASS